jgi:hypothetical protein
VNLFGYLLRARLRTRWRSWLALGLTIGIGAGVVLALAAGARRADTAAQRLSATTERADAFVDSGYFYNHSNIDSAQISRLPQVKAAGLRDELVVDGRTRYGDVIWPDESPDSLAIYEPIGRAEMRTLDRPDVTDGRLPAPGHPDEVVLDQGATRILGYGVGDTFALRFATTRSIHRQDTHKPAIQFDFRSDPRHYRVGPLVRLHVVGVARDLDYTGIWLSPGFYAVHDQGRLQAWVREDTFALRGGAAAVPAFRRAVATIAGGSGFDLLPGSDAVTSADGPVGLDARMVWAVVVVGALAMLALTAIFLTRDGAGAMRTGEVLRCVGIPRNHIALVGAGQGLAVGVSAASIATATAVALSPLFPIGKAGELEPSPGVSVDPAVLVAGSLGIIVVCTMLSYLTTWRAVGKRGERSARSHRPPAWLPAGGRLPVTAILGIRLGGRSTFGAPLAAITAAVAAIAAAAVVSASFTHLLQTPALYGQNWDYEIGQGGSPQPAEMVFLRSSPVVREFSAAATETTLSIDGRPTDVRAMGGRRSDVTPTIISGRAPKEADEVVLTPRTMRVTHAHEGSWVMVARGARRVRMRVVGEALLPPSDRSGLGDGAAVTLEGLATLAPNSFPSLFRVRTDPAIDARSTLAALNRGPMVVFASVPPESISDALRSRKALMAAAAIAAVLAVVVLGHALAANIGARRRDLATLKALGFTRSQLRQAVVWQAVAVALAATVVGLPLGVASGRWIWTLISDDLDVIRVTDVPGIPLLMLIPAVLLVASLTAAVPSGRAGGTPAAQVLRVE